MGKAVVLGGEHINKAVEDNNFYKLMPEFIPVRLQLEKMHTSLKSKIGCQPCNKRRIHANIDSNFAAIASCLHEDRAKVLKKYLGIGEDQKFYIRAVNPATKKPIMKVF